MARAFLSPARSPAARARPRRGPSLFPGPGPRLPERPGRPRRQRTARRAGCGSGPDRTGRDSGARTPDPASLPSFDPRATPPCTLGVEIRRFQPCHPCFLLSGFQKLKLNQMRASSRAPVRLLASPRMSKGFNLGREQRDNPPSPLCSKAIFHHHPLVLEPGGTRDSLGSTGLRFASRKMDLLEPVTESDRILRGKKMSETENRIFSHGIYRH